MTLALGLTFSLSLIQGSMAYPDGMRDQSETRDQFTSPLELAANSAFQAAIAQYRKTDNFFRLKVLKMTAETPCNKKIEVYRQSIKNYRDLDQAASRSFVKSSAALNDQEVRRDRAKDPMESRFRTTHMHHLVRDVRNMQGIMGNARRRTETQTQRLKEALRCQPLGNF